MWSRMSIYPLPDMVRIILHRKKWTRTRLAVEVGLSPRYLYDILNLPEGSFTRMPKGTEKISALFHGIFPNPIPAHMRHLSDVVDKVQWLRRHKNKAPIKDLLIREVGHWVMTFSSFEPKANASNIEKFVYSNLEGHV